MIERGAHHIHGPEWRISFPVSPLRVRVYDVNRDGMTLGRRKFFLAFGLLKFVRFGFHLRAGIQ